MLALLAPMTAIAQTQPAPAAAAPAPAAEAANALTEIVVTARRRDESVQDVPAVVNAITAEALQKMNIREFTEVSTLAPGLTLTTNANGVGGNAQVRGVNFDVNASGNNPTVEFYLNDAPITAGVVLQQAYDLGQIEVLRGPQGTLRGRASPSGSITVVTKKPDLYRFGGNVNTTINDIGTSNINGAVNIPVFEGVASLRIAGLYDESDANRVHTIDSSIPAQKPSSRTKSGRVSALVTPVDWLRLEGTFQTIDHDLTVYDQVESFSVVNPSAPASPNLIKAKDRRSSQASPRLIKQKFDIYNWRSEISLKGQQLIYQGQHYTQDLDSAGTSDVGNLFPTTNTYQYTVLRAKSTSHELRLQNQERVLGIFDYALGYFDNKNDTPTTLNSPTILRLPLAFGGGVAQVIQTPIARSGKSHEKSIFGNLTAHVGDATQISGGLRHIDYTDTGKLTVGGALLTSDIQADKKWIYTASAQHNFTSDLMVYASTGSSYRPGLSAIGNFNLVQSARERSFVTLPSESSKSYEAGVKSTLFDKKMRLNASVFHQKFANYPYRTPGSGVYYVNTVSVSPLTQQVGLFNFVAAVPVEVNGIEGEIAYDLTPDWNVGLMGGYALGKVKNGTIPCNDLNSDGKPDVVTSAPTLAQLQAAVGADNLAQCNVTQRSSFQPPFTATLQSEYTRPISGNLQGFARGLLNFNGKSRGDPANSFDDVQSYSLVNIFAGVRDTDRNWELTVYAKNLFNTTKVLTRTAPLSTSYQQLPGAIIGGVPTITGRPSAVSYTSTYTGITTTPAQEFGLNIRVAFGSR